MLIKNVDYLWIDKVIFIENGPMYSFIEKILSPYYKYLSGERTITYYNDNKTCDNEYAYAIYCYNEHKFIFWPNVKGALYVTHSQTNQTK